MARLFRDAYGVPHLRGDDLLDLARAQGRVCALDRTWQLEWLRRRASGTTAELAGATGEPWDRFSVGVRLVEVARRAFDALGTETRDFVAAYADGVSAGLRPAAETPELAALGVEAEPWPAWMPLAVFHAQQVLFGDLGPQLWRRHARSVLGEEAWLLGREGGSPGSAGSNAWAVGGGRTASGAPLLGGDPHRTFESPGVYHQVRLACEDPEDTFDVVGFSFAGVPGIQHFGHTGPVAWAITHAMASYQDLTPVGPDDEGPQALPGLAYRGAAEELGDLGLSALLPLLRARTCDDVERALDAWVEPVNNAVIADADGAVRYRLAGRVPTRDADGRWTGWLDTGAAPYREEVGPHGQIVTANERRGPHSAAVGVGFASPYRKDRIHALLEGRDDLTAADFEAIHGDDLLGDLEALRPLLPERLRGFDGRMGAGSTQAGDFAAWRTALVRRLSAHPRLAALHTAPPDVLLAPWYDATAVLGLALPTLARAGRPFGIDLAGLSVLADADVLAGRGDGPPEPWGARHVFAPLHAFDAHPGLPAAPAVPRTPLAGDADCVRCVGSVPGVTDAGVRGAVARYVWDLADREASGWVVPMGACGVPGDAHHLDQLPAWAEGRLLPVVTDWSRLSEQTLLR